MSGAPAVGLISNPGSGHNRDHFPALRRILDRAPGVTHRITRSVEDIPPTLEEFRSAGVRYLAINGGDGTVSAVLGALVDGPSWQTPPAIIILPAGTANMTAGDLGATGSLGRAVARFERWCAGEHTPRRDTVARSLLCISHNGQRRHGFFLGGGAVIAGTEYAHESLHSRGLRDDFSLALGVGRTLWGITRRDPRFLQRTPLTVTIDGTSPLQVDGLVLAISTLRRLAFGMRPFWGEGAGQGRITLLEHGCHHFVTNFLRIIAGRPGRSCTPERGYHSSNFTQLVLRTRGTLNMDGELLQVEEDLRIDLSPALQFLRL